MKFYQVTAQIERKDSKGWTSNVGVPTFYLRDDMQMIPNAMEAEVMARTMITRMCADPSIVAVHIGIAESKEFDPSVYKGVPPMITYEVFDRQTMCVVQRVTRTTACKARLFARKVADRLDLEYGAIRYGVRLASPAWWAGSGG